MFTDNGLKEIRTSVLPLVADSAVLTLTVSSCRAVRRLAPLVKLHFRFIWVYHGTCGVA